MNTESLLIYGLVAVGGWLLRHWGIGASIKVPGASTPASVATSAAAASTSHVPVLAILKADIDQIIKSAVEVAVKQAIEDIKAAAILQPPVKP
jgi:hypothetical protein